MKKYFYLFLLLFLCVPSYALADMAGPAIIGYDAVVINPNGAKFKSSGGEDEGSIPYNSVIHVVDEEDDEARFCLDKNTQEDECWGTHFVSKSDISPVNKEFIPSDKDTKNRRIDKVSDEIIVLNKVGVKLKKGPADIYEEYSETVPYKTILKSQYATLRDGEGGSIGISWYYINDAKYKGWVSLHNESIAYEYIQDAMLFSELKVVDNKGEVVMTIPAETILNKIYYIYDTGENHYPGNYYIKYNNKEGFASRINIGSSQKKVYVLTRKDTKITSLSGKERITVPSGKELKVLYSDLYYNSIEMEHGYGGPICVADNECYYYVEYNNVKGFIKSNDCVALDIIRSKNAGKYILKNTSQVYSLDLVFGNSDVRLSNGLNKHKEKNRLNKEIPAGSSITVIDIYALHDIKQNGEYNYDKNYYFYLINYDGMVGFITDCKLEKSNGEELKESKIEVEKEEKKETSEEVKENSKPIENKKHDEEEKEIKNKSNEIIIYAIIGAIIGCLFSIITMALVNKKKAYTRIVKKTESNDISDKKITKKED